MSLADRLKERFRSRLKRWIEREKAEVGCAVLATKRVAKKVGMSVAGIYRIVGNYPFPVKIQAHHYVAALVHTMKAPRRRVTMTVMRHREMA
jgi:hypothetical protein